MIDAWNWITDLGNSKIVALLIFFVTYLGILIYVFTGKERTRRLEAHKYIPFNDESEDRQEGDHDASSGRG